ncbi:sulfoxide reductase heme-binding subunit YedZ [Reinekea forsetii]|nr:sulfoxide reductase heme-binding subunit YedZ [Reinekea forsetii]
MTLKRLKWWSVYIVCALPFLIGTYLYLFDPRQLGIDPIEVLLENAGEWALRFLLITLCVSPLKRIGVRFFSPYRRMLGLYAFFYATLHLLTYTIGWISLDLTTFVEDITKRPFIYLGMLSWLVLLVLAITSPKAMVKKLKKNWVKVHMLIYPVILLVWVHLWLQSRASALEAVVYGAIILLLLGERVFRKVR